MKYVNTVLWEAHGFRLLRVSEGEGGGHERTLWAYELESDAEQLAPAQITSVAWGVLSQLVADGYRYWGDEPRKCRSCGGSGFAYAMKESDGDGLAGAVTPEALRTKALIAAVVSLVDALRSVATTDDQDGPRRVTCWCPVNHILRDPDKAIEDPWEHHDRCVRVRAILESIDPQTRNPT